MHNCINRHGLRTYKKSLTTDASRETSVLVIIGHYIMNSMHIIILYILRPQPRLRLQYNVRYFFLPIEFCLM